MRPGRPACQYRDSGRAHRPARPPGRRRNAPGPVVAGEPRHLSPEPPVQQHGVSRFVRAFGVAGTHRIGAGDPPAADHLVDHLSPDRRLVTQHHEGGGTDGRRGGCHPIEPGAQTQRQPLARACVTRRRWHRLPVPAALRRHGAHGRRETPREGAGPGAGRDGVEHAREHRTSLKRREQLVTAEPRGPTGAEDYRENGGRGDTGAKGNELRLSRHFQAGLTTPSGAVA